MRGRSAGNSMRSRPMLKWLTLVGAGLLVAGAAAARAGVGSARGGWWASGARARRFPAMVSPALRTQARRFLGPLGYGITLPPPAPVPGVGQGLDLTAGGGATPSGQLSINNWHF